MRSKEILSSGFTPDSDTTSGAGASPPAGRSPPPPPPLPPKRAFRGPSSCSSSSTTTAATTTTNTTVGYLDSIPAGARHWMLNDAGHGVSHLLLQGQHQQQQHGRTHAPRACEKCRLSKRKCDKKLPYCDRCMRLNAKCHYLPDPISANAGGNPIYVYQPPPSLCNDMLLRHLDPLATITAPQILSLIPNPGSSSSAAQSPVAGPESGGEGEAPAPDWRASVAEFFRFIHPWFAVVHPFLFERHVAELARLSPSHAHAHRDASPPVVSQPSPVSNSSGDYHPMSIKNAVSGYPLHHHHHHHHHRHADAEPGVETPGCSEHRLKQVALLVVCMHLITRLRVAETGGAPSPMFGAQYRTARRLLALMSTASGSGDGDEDDDGDGDGDSESLHTVELVQCGAILGLYEYGHGDAAAAYRTLGQTAATASILGIRPGSVGDANTDTDMDVDMDADMGTGIGRGRRSRSAENGLDLETLRGMEREQKSGLWWGLFILDQFIHKDDGTSHLPFLLDTPGQSTLLPETPPAPPVSTTEPGGRDRSGSERGFSRYRPREPQPRLPTSVVIGSVFLGPFQLSAKVSSLLHRALCFDRDRDRDRGGEDVRERGKARGRERRKGASPRGPAAPKMSLADFAGLDQEVRQTSQTLLAQTTQWEAMLDCFSMLVSALFTLYLPYLPVLESVSREAARRDEELKTALAALRFACKLSTDISCKINQELDSRSAPAPAPAPAAGPPTPNSSSYPPNSNYGHGPNTASRYDARRDSRNSSAGRDGEPGRGRDRAGDSGGNKDNNAENTDSGSLAVLAAPAGATCYSVIVAFAGLERIFPSERAECRKAIAEKFESLRLFSLRWGIAEEMVRQLEKKRGIHRADYVENPPSPSASASVSATAPPPPGYSCMMDISQ